MDFSMMEKAVYGNKNLEDDPELMAELLALENEELSNRAPPPNAKTQPRRAAAPPQSFGIDPAVMAAALADGPTADSDNIEEDEDLLNELSNLVGEPSSSAKASISSPPREQPARAAPPPPMPATTAHPSASPSTSHHLRELLKVYEKMKTDSEKENNAPKTRRLQRSTDKLKELIVKADRGGKVDPSEIPPAPPGWQPSPPPAASAPTPTVPPALESAIAKPAHHPATNPVRAAAHSAPTVPPPTAPTPPSVPIRKESASTSSTSTPNSKKNEVMAILHRRRKAYIDNGKAIAALETASADDLDLSAIPPTPPPYRKKVEPTTFVEHLEARCQRYRDMVTTAQKQGDDRKVRMNQRTVATYQEAIALAKSGKPVNVNELPALPDMSPLPPQGSAKGVAPRPPVAAAQPTNPIPRVKPPPAVGPLADSGPAGLSRNATQLQFLLQRQHQFKEAALFAKNRGDIETAKTYLLNAKGFDKMIAASKNGLPVNIKDTPIPPQVSTSSTTLEPKIIPSTTSATGVEGRGETLAVLEKGLIEQIQLAENTRMKFTRLGDVGKVKLLEEWAKTSKQDLLLIREVSKQNLRIPKFHIENRQIPFADIFPELAEDILELKIVQCRDIPLPTGYEPNDANIFIRYTFPSPTEAPQTGKSKSVTGTTSPEFDETVTFKIGSKKARGNKLSRILKRAPMKFEVYQKGSFFRSDKILGTCEWKLEELDGKAEIIESLPLKEGRKAVGGLLSVQVRVREPLGDVKLQITNQKWIIIDS